MTCSADQWFSEGVSNPFPASLEDFTLCWLLLDPFPEFSVADGLRPSNPKDSAKAGNVWIFFSVAALVLHVSAPHSRACFTLVFKILILMFMVRIGKV